MSKYLIIRTGRVYTKTLGRIWDVYTIIEERTGLHKQVYKRLSVYNFLSESSNKPDYARFVEPYHIGKISIRDARKLPEVAHGMIIEDGVEIGTIDDYFSKTK